MPKPKKTRIVQAPPTVNYFKPQGIPMRAIGRVVLVLEEYEALRLVDGNGLDQADAAEKMGVSRATCARILESARRKAAQAITGGMAIAIEGGNFNFRYDRLCCDSCGHTWESGETDEAPKPTCPTCGNTGVSGLAERYRQGPNGHGRQHRHGRERYKRSPQGS